MSQQKIPLRQLQQFTPAARSFLARNPAMQTSKLGHHISKISQRLAEWMKPLRKLDEERDEKIYDARVDFAETDDKGRIIYENIKDGQNNDVRQFVYTKENHKLVNKKVNELIREYEEKKENLLNAEVEIEPSIVSEVPMGLNFMELEILSGIVIPQGYQYPEKATNDLGEKPVVPMQPGIAAPGQ